MKHTILLILTAALLLSALTGCGAAGKQASTAAENEEGAGFTVRIENQSNVDLYSIAVRYAANGETLGSKVCERIESEADQPVYTFRFVPSELPTAPLDAFRLDVFAAEKAGEDYSICGSAVIQSPQPGSVTTLTLHGEAADRLTLSTAEQDIELN